MGLTTGGTGETFMGSAALATGFALTAGGVTTFKGTTTAALLGDLAGALATGFLGAAFATVFAAGLAGALATGLVTGLAATLAGLTALAAALVGALATGLVLATGFAGTLALAFAAALAGGLAVFVAGLAAALVLVLAAVALLTFPDLAFTWSLLAGCACLLSVAPWGVSEILDGLSGEISPARECTGLPIGKPISCKIETIIPLPAMVQLT